MATIYDVAKAAGYSITTVSKVLNNAPNVSKRARKKVLGAIQELDYMPYSSARTLATKKSNMIGVVFSEALGVGISHPFFSGVIEAFRKQVERYHYDLLFVSRNIGLHQNYHDHLKNRGVDGVIVLNLFSKDEEIQVFRDSNLPVVFIDTYIENANVVFSDNDLGCLLAIDYLYELGHRKIAHIEGDSTTFSGNERTKGFKKAIAKYKLKIPDTYNVDGGYFSYDGGYEAMLKLLAHDEHPTAVFISGDEMAIGAMAAAEEMGIKIPEDISIIGFDDIEQAKNLNPPLTTIRQEKELVGEQAATLLLNVIDKVPIDEQEKIVPVKLIKRKTCLPLNK